MLSPSDCSNYRLAIIIQLVEVKFVMNLLEPGLAEQEQGGLLEERRGNSQTQDHVNLPKFLKPIWRLAMGSNTFYCKFDHGWLFFLFCFVF